MRIPEIYFAATLLLFGTTAAVLAQNADNGRRLSERWCSECHAAGSTPDKFHGIPPFSAISARPNISAGLIISFLLLPHATMANPPLSRKDAEDIASYIIEMK